MSLHPRCRCDLLTMKCLVRNTASQHCGREFWRCPNWQTTDEDCKFFQWTDQNHPLDFHNPRASRGSSSRVPPSCHVINRNIEEQPEPQSVSTITGRVSPPPFDDFPVPKSSSARFSDAHRSLTLPSLPAHPHASPSPSPSSSCPGTPLGDYELSDTSSSVDGEITTDDDESVYNQKEEEEADVNFLVKQEVDIPDTFPLRPSLPLHRKVSDPKNPPSSICTTPVQAEAQTSVTTNPNNVSTNGTNASSSNYTTPTRINRSQSSKSATAINVTPTPKDLNRQDFSKFTTPPTSPAVLLPPVMSFGAPHTHASNLTTTQVVDLMANHLHRSDFLAAYQAQNIDKLRKDLLHAEQRIRDLKADNEELQKQCCNMKRKLDKALRENEELKRLKVY